MAAPRAYTVKNLERNLTAPTSFVPKSTHFSPLCDNRKKTPSPFCSPLLRRRKRKSRCQEDLEKEGSEASSDDLDVKGAGQDRGDRTGRIDGGTADNYS
jgi:hypothetical protein